MVVAELHDHANAANPWQIAQPVLARRVHDNGRRSSLGEPLVGLVDLEVGY